jgi:4-hydroxy-2-oxoheptanedioate aldolase
MSARINRAIELLEQGQPIYYTGAGERSYEGGKKAAGTWADFIMYEFEHEPFDLTRLHEFMRGLVDGGPTRSGHRTPAVICTLPCEGSDPVSMRANTWIVKQVLAQGVHGLLLCHAESPEAVKIFVEAARYPFAPYSGTGLEQGRRGAGGQAIASQVWGMTGVEYVHKADVWPLNPKGEILLGLKIENHRAVANVEASVAVPGIGFAEWGPGDMGMSYGFPDNHDEPFPKIMENARARVFAAARAAGIAFLNTVREDDVEMRIDEGVRICSGPHGEVAAEKGRRYTKRTMPW